MMCTAGTEHGTASDKSAVLDNLDVGEMQGDLKATGHWFAETWTSCSCGCEALVHAELVRAQMRSCGCTPGTRPPQRRPGFPNAPQAKRL
jgi:hypothetical protein